MIKPFKDKNFTNVENDSQKVVEHIIEKIDNINDGLLENTEEGMAYKVLLFERIGRFQMVQLEELKSKVRGVGVARLADGDKRNDNKAYAIAFGRAKKAINLKLQGKPVKNVMMG